MNNDNDARYFDTDAAERQDGVRILPEPQPSARTPYTGPPAQDVQPRRRPPTESYMPQPASAAAPPEAKKAKGSSSACAIIAGTFALLALSCALLAFATFQGGVDGLRKLTGIIPSFGGITLVTTPTVTIDLSRPTVIDSVRSLSKLETVHYQLEKVISGKSAGPLPDIFTSDKILLVAHGEVVAGIDLGKVAAEDVTVTGTTAVKLRLPAPEILYSKLDNSKTYVYDRQTGVFSKPDPNLESQLRQAAEQQIVNAATEDGILAKASDNARQTLRTMLGGMGYTDVQFEETP